MESKIYWLIAGRVTTTHPKNGTEHHKNLNVVVITEEPKFTRRDIAKAQEGLQRRFVTECTQIPGFRISDVFIQSFNLLGHMTHEEFNAGFNTDVKAAGGVN